MDVIDRVEGLGTRHAVLRQEMMDARTRARAYAYTHGEDIPEVAEWTWSDDDRGNFAEAAVDTGGDNV